MLRVCLRRIRFWTRPLCPKAGFPTEEPRPFGGAASGTEEKIPPGRRKEFTFTRSANPLGQWDPKKQKIQRRALEIILIQKNPDWDKEKSIRKWCPGCRIGKGRSFDYLAVTIQAEEFPLSLCIFAKEPRSVIAQTARNCLFHQWPEKATFWRPAKGRKRKLKVAGCVRSDAVSVATGAILRSEADSVGTMWRKWFPSGGRSARTGRSDSTMKKIDGA